MNPVVGRMLVAAVASAAATAALALPTVVQADWVSCTNGKYAIALPRHLSTLRTIGRHRIVDREVRSGDGQTASARTIEYFGLRLDVAALPGDPTRIRFLAAESISRRWDIGRLSVGDRPWWWPWSRENALAGIKLDGELKLVGPTDTVLLSLSDGRIEKVSYFCGPTPRP